MVIRPHECSAKAIQRVATAATPYHFVASGLPNVFLEGIRYRICDECGTQSADIPGVEQLLQAIARELVRKGSRLTGAEIRFLRKRLGKKAADFAAIIGVEPETYSKWENDRLVPSETADGMIRLSFAIDSGDRTLFDELHGSLADVLLDRDAKPASSRIHAHLRQNSWKVQRAA